MRLDWGELALAVLDVRSHRSFNSGHIRGAIATPANHVVEIASTLFEMTLDIYLYGETDAESACVAAKLRAAGFERVFEIVGGLPAWQAAGYPVESIFPRSPVAPSRPHRGKHRQKN